MKGTIDLKTAADVLDKDVQTVRVMIQNGVSWGECVRGRGNSNIYLIYKEKFADATGYKEYNPQEMDGTKQFCEILSEAIEQLQRLQTEKSDDLFIFHDCQKVIDYLDGEVDQKRR